MGNARHPFRAAVLLAGVLAAIIAAAPPAVAQERAKTSTVDEIQMRARDFTKLTGFILSNL